MEAPGWLGLDAGQLVLEAGCRDATHAIGLVRRYGCRVLGVDLVGSWLPGGRADAAAAGLASKVDLLQGDLEALPVADGVCDLVWCRDVLSCVEDAGRMLRECARVVRPGGGMVLYAVFATDELALPDRALLVEGLGNSRESMDQPTAEAAIAAAGFEVVRRERIASEWSEYQLEQDPGYLTEDLLEIARLTRDRDRAEAVLGPIWYRRALGSPPGGCRSSWVGSCRSSMPWGNRPPAATGPPFSRRTRRRGLRSRPRRRPPRRPTARHAWPAGRSTRTRPGRPAGTARPPAGGRVGTR